MSARKAKRQPAALTEDELIAKLPGFNYMLKRVFWIRRVLDRHDIEDLRQQTFLIVIEKIRSEGLDKPDLLVEYVRKVAWNLSTLHRRRFRRKCSRFSDGAELSDGTKIDHDELLRRLPDCSRSVEEIASGDELACDVRRAMARVRNRDREALERAYLHDEPHRAIAESMVSVMPRPLLTLRFSSPPVAR